MLDLEEAQARILADVEALGTERVSLEDSIGRVLASDVVSNVNLPPFDYSAMDGYAIALGSGPQLRVVGESRAGTETPSALAMGTAMRILTGAPIPPGADTVVMQEETKREGDALELTGTPRKGDHIRHAGEDLAMGAVALSRGLRLRSTHIPLLASLEIVRPQVTRRPVVTVLATGDELREPGAPARPGSIVESNAPTIAALAREAGANVRLLPIVADERDKLKRALNDALDGADIVLTIGGVSVGDHDLVKPMLAEVGVTLDFWKVSIKPGKPLAVGRRDRTRVLGLPGNPVSAVVTFLLFGAPLIRKLSGDPSVLPVRHHARIARDVKHHPGRTELLRARTTVENGERVVTPVGSQASGSVVSIAWADALVVIPKDSKGVSAGTMVEAILL